VHETAGLRTAYWDWTAREGEVHYQKYCGTPPEHLLFGLRKALDLLLAEGLDAAIRRHALLAEATRAAVAKWAEGQALAFNIASPAERANSVTCVLTQGFDPKLLLTYCRENCGVVLGIGLAALDGKAFRIAHMGHVNAPMMFGTLGAVEMALRALGIPHGAGGVQAAVEYLGREVHPAQQDDDSREGCRGSRLGGNDPAGQARRDQMQIGANGPLLWPDGAPSGLEAALRRREAAALAQKPVVAARLIGVAHPRGRAFAPPAHTPRACGNDAPLMLVYGAVDRALHAIGRGIVSERHGKSECKGQRKRACSSRNPAGHLLSPSWDGKSARRTPPGSADQAQNQSAR
jgi:hypothetical protein